MLHTIVFSDDTYFVRSRGNDFAGMMSTRDSSLEFNVQACRNARIVLLGDIDGEQQEWYTILLGAYDNTRVSKI